MTLSSDLQMVTATVTGLAAITYIFTIEFEYTTTFSSQAVGLASATQDITPVLGPNALPSFSGYVFADDNADGRSNLDDIAAGIDPGLCVVAASVDSGSQVDNCRL